ncbi:unnamed protein product [Sphagnum balticum]
MTTFPRPTGITHGPPSPGWRVRHGHDKPGSVRALRNVTYLFTNNDTLLDNEWTAMYPVTVDTTDGLQQLCYLSVPREVGRVVLRYCKNARFMWTLMRAATPRAQCRSFYKCTTGRSCGTLGGTGYGGYATLIGMTFTPDVFQCGVDVGGPTNLITFVESIADADARADMQRKIGGDPATEEDNFVAELNRYNITSAMYVLYPNEAQTIARVENVLAFTAKVEQFFADCLRGRMEATGG